MIEVKPQIPNNLYSKFKNYHPMFLVIGILEEINHPKQPPQQRIVSFHVGSMDELLTSINKEGLKIFDVFQVTGKFSNESDLRKDAQKIEIEQTEARERKLLEELKLKYESKLKIA